MKLIRQNIFGYHAFSFLTGVVFALTISYSFNTLGALVGPIFQIYQPQPENIFGQVLINFILSFFASIIPALVIMAIVHWVLQPKSMLFWTSASVAFVILSYFLIRPIHASDIARIHPEYLYFEYGKRLGALMAFYLVGFLFLRKYTKGSKRLGH